MTSRDTHKPCILKKDQCVYLPDVTTINVENIPENFKLPVDWTDYYFFIQVKANIDEKKLVSGVQSFWHISNILKTCSAFQWR